jgi:hypothetical protein
MKYAIVKVSNGSYSIQSEGWTDIEKAKIDFANIWKTLMNAKDVQTACIAIVDENLDNVEGYKEFIDHRPVTQYVEITDPDAVAEDGVTYYVLINNQYVADTGVEVGDRVFGKYVVAE